jgi:hypothetical protein
MIRRTMMKRAQALDEGGPMGGALLGGLSEAISDGIVDGMARLQMDGGALLGGRARLTSVAKQRWIDKNFQNIKWAERFPSEGARLAGLNEAWETRKEKIGKLQAKKLSPYNLFVQQNMKDPGLKDEYPAPQDRIKAIAQLWDIREMTAEEIEEKKKRKPRRKKSVSGSGYY